MKTTLRTVCLMLVLTIAFTSSVAFASDVLSNVKDSGTLKVAVPQDFPPFGSVGSDLKPIGYDIDMAELIATKLGVKVVLTPVTSTNRIPYLTTGKVDLVISSLGKNPKRAAVIDFSEAYAPFFNGVFGTDSVTVSSAADLADKTVAVTRGSIEDLELTKIAPESTVIKRFEDNSSTITAFQSGQVDLVATGNVVAASINKKNPAKMLKTKFMIKNSPCYVGIAKEQGPLMTEVNSIIEAAKKDGSLNAIAVKWLHNPLPETL